MGDPVPEGPTIEAALEAVAAARREVAAALNARDTFREEITKAEGALQTLGYRRRDAIAAVIDVETAIDKLAEYFEHHRACAEAAREVFRWLGATGVPKRYQWWDAINREITVVDQLLPSWQKAIGMLEDGDVDCPLPGGA